MEHKIEQVSISVSIVLWNSRNLIKNCLDSLLKQSRPPKEIILVDNASSDNIGDIIKCYNTPTIQYHALPTNQGFAAAQNRGIHQCTGSWILVMNPDVVLAQDYLERILESPLRKERVGMLTGKILRMSPGKDHKPIIDSTGVQVGFSRAMYDIGEGEADYGQYDTTAPRNAVSCCCSLLKREMLEDICEGGQYFDESLFMYLEDVDLCWRAYLKGWDGLYVSSAVAYHKRGGTRKKSDAPFFRKLNLRNRYIVLFRNDSIVHLLTHFPFLLLYEFLLFLRIIRYPYLLQAYAQTAAFLVRNRKCISRSVAHPGRRAAFLNWDLRFIGRKVLGVKDRFLPGTSGLYREHAGG